MGETTIRRPPLGVLVKYRLLGIRVPLEYLAWVERDIRSRGWFRRSRLFAVVAGGVVSVVFLAIFDAIRGTIEASTFMFICISAAIWVLLFVISGRLEDTRFFLRERAQSLAYQRGEASYPGSLSPPSRADIPWLIGAAFVALAIVLVVRAVT